MTYGLHRYFPASAKTAILAHPVSPMTTAAQPACLSAQPFQMLVRIARHSDIGDPDGCAAILALLATGRSLRAHLQRVLTSLDLSEVKFAVLVSLYAQDPAPCSLSELSAQAEVSRASLRTTLDALSAGGWIETASPSASASVRPSAQRISLTPRGRTLTEKTVRPFLTAVARCGEVLSASERQAVTRSCNLLQDRLPSTAS